MFIRPAGPSKIAKLSCPRSGPHQTCSSGPHNAWNNTTWAVRTCLPNLSRKQALTWPHVSCEPTEWTRTDLVYKVCFWLTCGPACGSECHHSMRYVGQMNVPGTLLLSGMPACSNGFKLIKGSYGLSFKTPKPTPQSRVHVAVTYEPHEKWSCNLRETTFIILWHKDINKDCFLGENDLIILGKTTCVIPW